MSNLQRQVYKHFQQICQLIYCFQRGCMILYTAKTECSSEHSVLLLDIYRFVETRLINCFTGSKQGALILNISVQNCYLSNDIPQTIFPYIIV